MNAPKFWLYCFLTTLIWSVPSCILILDLLGIQKIVEAPLLIFIFLLIFDVIRDEICQTPEEKALEKEKLNKSLILRDAWIILVKVLSVAGIFFIIYKVHAIIDLVDFVTDNVIITMLLLVGGFYFWSSSIYRAWKSRIHSK